LPAEELWRLGGRTNLAAPAAANFPSNDEVNDRNFTLLYKADVHLFDLKLYQQQQ
jgi:hypothetical protein